MRHTTYGARMAVALWLAGTTAWAGVAGTGTFDIDFDGFPPPVTFAGTLTFMNDPRTVGGSSVNLGSSVGAVPYSGSATVDGQALRATFDLTATEPGFSMTGNGLAACTTACLGGTATFVGDITSISGGGLPTGFGYTFDGTVSVNFLGLGTGGTFALNAFADVPTPSGTNVPASSGLDSYFDTKTLDLREFLVELVFSTVNTPGTTRFLGVTAIPGALPNGITLIPDESVFIDIQTTADFSGPVDVCVAYTDVDMDGVVDGTSVLVSQLRLLHALATGGDFVDVTMGAPGGGKVCGQVTSLSPFVVAAGPAPTTTTSSTTTTTTSTTTTTTTTLPELLAGKKLLLKDKTGKPEKRGLDLILSTPTLSAGNTSEDDPVTNGGALRVVSATGGFDTTYALPAGGWKYQGKAGQGKGYKFKGTGAIKSVLVKSGKLARVIGKGSALGHDLAGNPDPVAVVLELGAQSYCGRFGGSPQFKDGTKYLAKTAPAPAECGSPSGAFLD